MSRMIEVKQAVTCKRCGDEQVAWTQSKKSGKWYLAQAYRNGDAVMVNPVAFHQCSGHTQPGFASPLNLSEENKIY